MIVVLMGIQGCGKGTQAKLLAKHYSWQHINLGGLFRKEIAKNTKKGNEIKHYIDNGNLVPDEIVYHTIEKVLGGKKRGFIFDGFPRTLAQAHYLVENHNINKVIFFDLEDDIARARMDARRVCSNCNKDYNILSKPPKKEGICDDCGHELIRRTDDSLEGINQRINLFHEQTKPLCDFFKERGLLFVVNANQGIQEINDQVRGVLDLIKE